LSATTPDVEIWTKQQEITLYQRGFINHSGKAFPPNTDFSVCRSSFLLSNFTASCDTRIIAFKQTSY
jgi:hypothetical protein